MKKLKSQSGRSMVEMLGVLAIIGVLSVGGIAGYSLSMRKHRANGIVDIASKYALVTYGQCQQKVMHGEDDGAGCYNFHPLFDDAGIGPLPAGVKKMYINYVAINSANMTDCVDLSIQFTDAKLCQDVSIYAGTASSSGCDNDVPEVSFAIKQN